MATKTQRIKRAGIKNCYPLRQGRAQPSHTNPTVRRGGSSGDKKKFRVHEPLVVSFNKHVQFEYRDNPDGSAGRLEMYVICWPRKFKFDLEDFERHFDLSHEGFSDFYMQHDFPDDIPLGNLTELNILLNHNRTTPRSSRRIDAARQGESTLRRQGFSPENGLLVWYNKEERVARKRQQVAGGSGDPEESVSEGDDAEVRPK
ncbi:hypothetical protein LIER_11934 [Lithospermum erythrorhizon]|uniref:Uncharacterized protein n=1 Tax=Lithospermum erythrorhizon TaxID=34254 RepID=A0AAV3PR24_LITER